MAGVAQIETATDEIEDRTKPSFLRRVRIQGYKSIASCNVRLAPLTILVGRNAAGKSNFLDALAFLRDGMDVGFPEAVKRRGGWNAVICHTSDSRTIEFEVEVAFVCGRSYRLVGRKNGPIASSAVSEAAINLEGVSFLATYRLKISADNHSLPILRKESLDIADTTNTYRGGFVAHEGDIERWRKTSESGHVLPLPRSRDLSSIARPGFTLLGSIGPQPFVDLADALRTMKCYNLQPEAMRPVQKPLPGAMLEKDGRNFASVIDSLTENDPDAMDRVREYLSIIAEEVSQFETVRYGEYETVKFLLHASSDRNPIAFDAVSMSDGTLRALGVLLAAFQIHLPAGPSVVGIEEPEAALHPAATHTLVDALQDATQKTQILLTTHSGDLLADRDLDPSQILVVRNRNGETRIAPIDPGSREIIRKELYSLADLQRMDQLELDEADLDQQFKAQAVSEEN